MRRHTFIWRVVINALALMAVASLMRSVVFESVWSTLMAALVLGVLNAVIRPVPLLFSLPINIITLGLFTFVVNGFMLWLVSRFVGGFAILSLGASIWAAILLSIVSAILSWLLGAPGKH